MQTSRHYSKYMFHDETWQQMRRYPRILMHLPSFKKGWSMTKRNNLQRGGIQKQQGWERCETGTIRAQSPSCPQRTAKRGMEQWHPTPNCSYNYQTADTKTSVFMVAGPKHWQRRLVICQVMQEAQKGKSEDMPNQKRKEIRKDN